MIFKVCVPLWHSPGSMDRFTNTHCTSEKVTEQKMNISNLSLQLCSKKFVGKHFQSEKNEI